MGWYEDKYGKKPGEGAVDQLTWKKQRETAGERIATGPYSMTEITGTWAGPASNRMLRQDVDAMQAGELGWSDAEKEQYASEAQTAAGMQAQAGQQELARQQLASGTGFGGQYGELMQQMGGTAGGAAAQAQAQANELSRQQGEARRAEILGRLERQQDRGRENIQWATDEYEEYVGTVMDVGLSSMGPGSIMP
jgi:hypothetical protein